MVDKLEAVALFGRRKIEDRALTRDTIPSVFLPDQSAAAVGPRAATRLGDVYAAVRVLADSAASLPLIAYRRTPEGACAPAGGCRRCSTNPRPPPRWPRSSGNS
jgi:phage portal protein BeeE